VIGECMIIVDGEGCIGYDEFICCYEVCFECWLWSFVMGFGLLDVGSDQCLSML